MAQSICSVVLDVRPQSADLLRDRIRAMKVRLEGVEPKYDSFRKAVPSLHFMSLTVCDDPQYDPVFVVEINFDGAPGPFWGQLEAAMGADLREMLRYTKPPTTGAGALHAAITEANSHSPVAPLLEARTVKPAVFHQGNRGLDRLRIAREGELFRALQVAADAPALRTLSAVEVHAKLQTALVGQFDWLKTPVPDRIGIMESLMDYGRFGLFGLSVVVCLLIPGAAGSVLFPTWVWPAGLVLAIVWCGLRLKQLDRDRPVGGVWSWLAGAGAIVAGACSVLQAFRVFAGGGAGTQVWPMQVWPTGVMWGSLLLTPIVLVLGGLVWLRGLERADPFVEAPELVAEKQRRMAENEDHIVQNHMISIVHVKPGILRSVLMRLGLTGLGLLLRIIARNGYLATMRTIHFAHWAIISNGGRLMFHSNFDGSWESYLDDFIEKAHVGLTLAWTSGVGFPRTRFLIKDGAERGRLFKAWARHSMTESLFWFSAYRDLSVNQIERNARLANGLRKTSLTPQEAVAWTRDL